MAKSLLVVITKPPYGLEEAFAGLRLALAMAVNGMKTTVLMLEDGVFNSVATQKPEAIKMPSNIEATKDLYDFEVQVYVVKEDLQARGIPESSLFEGLKAIESAKMKDLIAEHDLITTF
ncbi:MAG: DsrE family protein [Candidatus Thermoplasmatota archaeon]|nr:DsrE family protein [Candidatus Thermoplasmatota archaeon]